MRKKVIISAIIISLVSTLIVANIGESERLNEKKDIDLKVKYDGLNFYEYEMKQKQEMNNVALKQQEESKENKIEENKRPIFSVQIPLTDEILDYVFEQSEENGIPYTLVLAIMNVESEFDSNEISRTQDYGLLQINRSNINWISKELGIINPKPLDERQNIQMGIYYMKHIKDYWSGREISDEQMFTIVCLSYHMGVEGSKRWIKHYGWNSGYVNKVLEYKSMLEQNIVEGGYK